MPPRPFSGLSGRTSDPGRSRGILQTRPKPQKASASFLRLVVFIASEALPADKLPLAAVDDDPFRSFKKTILSSRLAQTPRRSVHRKHAGRRSTDRRHHARASLQTVRRALNIDIINSTEQLCLRRNTFHLPSYSPIHSFFRSSSCFSSSRFPMPRGAGVGPLVRCLRSRACIPGINPTRRSAV